MENKGDPSRGAYNRQTCLQLDFDTWKEHSALNERRRAHSAVVTKTATFVFGGTHSRLTYEYLPKDSTTWLPGKTRFPECFQYSCAIVSESENEIWLIGDSGFIKRILCFNVNEHTFRVMPSQLNVGRHGHRCAFIPNTMKVMITGGHNNDSLDSTEILDTEVGSITMASPMNFKRRSHAQCTPLVSEWN